MSIDDTLKERGSRYGKYEDNSRVSQAIKEALRSGTSWHRMTQAHRETVDMIAQKLCRIVNGDPDYDDNYRDIIGYSELMLRIIATKGDKLAAIHSALHEDFTRIMGMDPPRAYR